MGNVATLHIHCNKSTISLALKNNDFVIKTMKKSGIYFYK